MPEKANIDPYSDPVVETILKEFRESLADQGISWPASQPEED